YEQAAQELGWPKSSLANRLTRGRDLLRRQLVRRGIALSAGVLTAALREKAAAAPVTALLTIDTVRAATLVAAGKAVVGEGVSTRALALAEETMRPIFGGKLVCLALALVVAAGSAGLAVCGASAEK